MRRTKEEAENTREDILNAAVRVFSEKGVTGSTLEDIARAASVTRGAIYWHFKNKIEIFDALHDRLHRPLLEMIMEDMKKDHPEPLVQLRDLCIQLLLDLEKDEQKRRALALFLLRCDYSGELSICKEKNRIKKEEKQKAFSRYFEKAKAKGRLPPESDPEFLTLSINCYMKGILFEYLENPERFKMNKKAPRLINFFFGNMGLLPRQED